ncbi:hypothetical protein V1506DRAFT_508805 [Lipomyces tetrasporus]
MSICGWTDLTERMDEWPPEFRTQGLSRYYNQAEKMLRPTPYREDLLAHGQKAHDPPETGQPNGPRLRRPLQHQSLSVSMTGFNAAGIN